MRHLGWWRGTLPEGWRVARLKDVVAVTNGLPFSAERFSAVSGVPLIRIRDLLRGATSTFYDGPVPDEVVVRNGDLLVGMDGEFNSVVWRGGIGALNQRVCRLRAVGRLDQRYLCYLIDLPLRYINNLTYSTTVKHLSSVDLLNERIPLPPLGQQNVIVDFLDVETARIDALIAKKFLLSRLLLDRWLAHLCATLLPGGVDPATGCARKAKWEARPLWSLFESSWGGDWGADPGEEEVDLTCVRAADFDFVRLRATGGVQRSFRRAAAEARALRPGDLVIEKSGGGEGVSVGRVVAWRGEVRAIPTNFAGGLRPAVGVDPDFALLVLRAAYEIGLPWRSIKQTTGLQNLDLGHYLSHRWPVPAIADQRRIASNLLDQLERVLEAQTKLERQVALLQEHRQALITAAVTGELEVPGVAA